MKKLLLFGAQGQLGREIQQRFASGPFDLIAIGRSQVDLTDPQQLRDSIRRISPSIVINAAAYTAVDKAESEPDLAGNVNAIAPAVIAEECKRAGAFLVHYSTDYVFDGKKGQPYTEADRPAPLNVYGATKLQGDEAILDSGVRHLILRVGWVYSAQGKNFFLTVLRLAREGKPMRIVNDQVGVPTTTAAIAEVTDLALSRTQSLEGLYHFAPGEQTSWFGFAAEIVRLMGLRMEVTPIPSNEYPTAARRPAYSVMSVERLKCDLPLNVPSWQELLRCTAARYKPQDIIHL